MIRKKAAAAAAAFLWITLLAGCGATDLFDRVREMEHKGGPFQNNLESARAYMLDQLQEKYGVEFFIVGNEKLENYGPLAGALMEAAWQE